MKRIELYECEVCGAQYTEKTDAMRCEKGHKRPGEIVYCKYAQGLALGYPIEIDVKFGNEPGVVTYRRSKISSVGTS